jgi:ANTAR domain-containing protein
VPTLPSMPSPDGARPAAPGGAALDGARSGPGRSAQPAIDAGRPGAADGSPAGELEALRHELEGLRAALASRATIDQARGILIARFHLSPEGAFELLVRWSQDRNIKLRTIAGTLVALAQHGVDGPGVDRALGSWLAQQLAEAPPPG